MADTVAHRVGRAVEQLTPGYFGMYAVAPGQDRKRGTVFALGAWILVFLAMSVHVSRMVFQREPMRSLG